MFVVDDLLANINGGAVKVESNFYDVDRAHNSRAKAAGFQEVNLLLSAVIRGDWFQRHSSCMEL